MNTVKQNRIISLCVSIFWIIHSFNLIPGNFRNKISLYLVSVFIMFLMIKPKWSYGIYILIAHIIAYLPQIYVIWERYHSECKTFNAVEYEKNINNFLYSQFPEIIITLDSKYEIIRINDKASKLFEDQKYKNFKEYSSELKNENDITLYEELIEKNKLHNYQFSRNKGKENEEKLLVSSSSFEIDYSKIIIIIIRNVTQFYKMQEKNISDRYQNILLFSATHEVRSQLNIISGNIERLEKKFDPDLLKIAKYGCRVLEYKLNLIFDFVHIVTGKFAAHLKQYVFKDFILEIVDIIDFFASSKNLKFIKKYRTTCEIISFDYERFVSMIIHIALNAIKHTFKGIIKLKVEYRQGILLSL